jgi:hypothetical protein
LIQEETTKRLICFGVDGASIFQGCHTRLTFQLKEKFAPYMMGQHCMAHWMNIANCSNFVKSTHGGQVGRFVVIAVFLSL